MCIKQLPGLESVGLKGGLKKPPKRVQHRISKMVKIVDNGEKLAFEEDALAISTKYTKEVFNMFNNFVTWFQNSHYYKVLFGTTQPAHFVTALAVTIIAFLSIPQENHPSGKTNFSILKFIYLTSFSLHFGAQIWMTFVSGLSLYFNIPRHTFGSIQKVLFPRYFLLNACLSFITLGIFLRLMNGELLATNITIQAAVLTVCFLSELIIRLYWTGPLIHLIGVKNQLEEAAGVGTEIGKINPGSLMTCPYYLKIHKTFRRCHMTIAIGNMLAMACSVFHLFYLSQKICIM